MNREKNVFKNCIGILRAHHLILRIIAGNISGTKHKHTSTQQDIHKTSKHKHGALHNKYKSTFIRLHTLTPQVQNIQKTAQHKHATQQVQEYIHSISQHSTTSTKHSEDCTTQTLHNKKYIHSTSQHKHTKA